MSETTKTNTTSVTTHSARVTASTSIEDVVKLDKEDVRLEFSANDFCKIPDDVVADLSEANRARYLAVWSQLVTRGLIPEISFSAPEVDVNQRKLQLPERPGWHTSWVDGRFVDAYKSLGYRVMYEMKGKAREVRKIQETNPNRTTSELVAMEIPLHVYEARMRAQTMSDKEIFRQSEAHLMTGLEELNRRYGGKGREVSGFTGTEEREDDVVQVGLKS